jgi:hypothetical protein
LTALAKRVGDGDQLSGDSGDDDLVRFSSRAEAICEGFQAWVVMCCDQRRLEHYMPQRTATACDGPFSAKDSAVVRDRGSGLKALFRANSCGTSTITTASSSNQP